MFLTKFDWLTPPVTLYYKGELQHSSIGSAVISIIGYLTSICIGLYLSFDFFCKGSPTVFCFNRYIEDAGNFYLNSSGVFSHFQIYDTKHGKPGELDFTKIRVIGIESSIQNYVERNNTTGDDHWLYGLCNNDSDIKGIESLYKFSDFNLSYCIKKYFKKEDKKYYSIGDENFRWPNTDKGTSNDNKTFYVFIFEACKEDEAWEIVGGEKCKSDAEIREYMNTHYVRFFMIDYYPDVYNYKNPFKKYFFNIDTTLSSGSYTYNHINFNPAKIISHNGIFFDKSVETHGYIVDQNTQESGEYHGAYLAFYFWLKNKIIIYERTYKTFQDVFAEIEGMSDLIILFATVINNFMSEYITLKDTAHVLFTLRSKNVNRTEIKRILQTKRRTMFSKDFPPKKNNINSNKNDENSDRNKINNNNSNLKVFNYNNKKKRQILYKRVIGNKNKYYENSGISENSKTKRNITMKNKSSTLMPVDNYNNIEKKEKPKDEKVNNIKNSEDEISMPSFDPFKETKLNFLEFAYNYIFFCKKKKNSIEIYDNFRMKIISEENMIQNYLDIHTHNKLIEQMTRDEELINQ